MKNKLALYNVASLTLYFILAFFTVRGLVENIPVKSWFLGIFASWLMLVLGVQIVHFRFKEGEFVNRFLGATVFQMLGFMSLAVYLIYTVGPQKRPLVLSLVLVYMIALVIQTLFFLRQGKSVR